MKGSTLRLESQLNGIPDTPRFARIELRGTASIYYNFVCRRLYRVIVFIKYPHSVLNPPKSTPTQMHIYA